MCDGVSLQPALSHQGRKHACLCQRGFADARIAQKNRELVRRRRKRRDHLDRFFLPAEKEVGVGLGHRRETAIGRSVSPQIVRGRASARGSIQHPGKAFLGRRVRRYDPVQLPQERQSRRGLAFEQYENDRKIALLDAAIERLVVLEDLPWAEPVPAH
jgi:hypothetical protein